VSFEHAEGADAHRRVVLAKAQKAQKRSVIGSVAEDPAAFRRPVYNVINVTARGNSMTTWHDPVVAQHQNPSHVGLRRPRVSILKL
jgi:hypothetical protein